MVNSAGSDSRVENDAFTVRRSSDLHLCDCDLFGDEWRDVWFERSCPNSHDYQANNEGTEGAAGLRDDGWDGGDDEDDVPENRNSQSNADRTIAA